MPVLSDRQIFEQVRITPFSDCKKRPGQISYGVSSYGYDVRVGPRFKVMPRPSLPVRSCIYGGPQAVWDPEGVIDPKSFDAAGFYDVDATDPGFVVIPPNSFALAETVEEIEVPRDILVICVGKSTYARCGIVVNVTPLEPEWRGKVTLEISNTTPLPAKVYANEGIAQMIFLRAEQVCQTSYADKQGKYQDQAGLTLPKVD
jgi:dCTP deaminase